MIIAIWQNAKKDGEVKMNSMETYTPEQFARSLYLRGYMGRKKAAEYVSDHPKEVWLESDFEKVYDEINREYMRNKPIKGLTSNGQNKFSPENMGKWR